MDVAAGILIVKEAGGTLNDISKYDDESINIRAASSNIFKNDGKTRQVLIVFINLFVIRPPMKNKIHLIITKLMWK